MKNKIKRFFKKKPQNLDVELGDRIDVLFVEKTKPMNIDFENVISADMQHLMWERLTHNLYHKASNYLWKLNYLRKL